MKIILILILILLDHDACPPVQVTLTCPEAICICEGTITYMPEPDGYVYGPGFRKGAVYALDHGGKYPKGCGWVREIPYTGPLTPPTPCVPRVGVCERTYWCWDFRQVPLSAFFECFHGPGVWLSKRSHPLFCAMFDGDDDHDVDLYDYSLMLPRELGEE